MNRAYVSGVKRPYEILIGKGILNELAEVMEKNTKAQRIVIITDDNVDKYYSETVMNILENAGYKTFKFVFSHGEKNKTLNTVADILEFMAENNITRSDCIAALGGGIVGDVSGFAAASYLRGISFVQLPTTFLAAIDSSVGGKTGVNLKAGKNLAGAFYQPRAVLCDIDTFKTLPEENFKEGIAEAIKYGVICDRGLFDILKEGTAWNTEDIIEQCVSIKAKIVAEDELDTGKRQLLNFGHTIGHAVEKCSGFTITHGAAVGIGMAMISKAAEKLGWSEKSVYPELLNALKKNKLRTEYQADKKALVEVMEKDKKITGNNINLVIPKKIGNCVLKKIPVEQLVEIIAYC